ncbi:hypothetical protein [Acaryochloris thomasi]|uniref:hypothetical protein n=1 Tax=Acaryochloris thomasi TaxID=2929456 RepID=UPI000DA6CF09|nr:hypothetical protein [Acaryochloris thomasi]
MTTNATANLWIFLVKILVLSAVISVAIRYLGPLLPLPATSSVALALVLSPTVIMSVALAWRANQS